MKFNLVKPVYADINLGPIQGVGKYQQSGDAPTQLESLVSAGITVLTIFAGLVFIVYFLYGALNWITAGGKPDNVAKAQKTITDAVIGLIIVVISYFLVGIIGGILGVDILNPAKLLNALGA